MSPFVELSWLVIGRSAELRQDAVGEALAELDAPLVESVHAPDHALRKNLVLVKRDQRAQRARRQSVQQERAGRPVAGENFVWQQPFELLRR